MSPVSRSRGPGRRRRRRRLGPCVPGADRNLALPLGRTLDLAIALEWPGSGKMKRDPLSTRKQRLPGDDRRGETRSSRRRGQEDKEVIRRYCQVEATSGRVSR